jgi:MFS family permease
VIEAKELPILPGSACAPATPVIRKRQLLLGMLVLLSVTTYLDRIAISVAGPLGMQKELGLSPERWGWVLGIFILSYGLGAVPLGALGDRNGQRTVLTQIVVWWSVFTGLTGLAMNYAALLVTRFLFGAGEAGAYPNISGVIARWFPTDERARSQGFVWAASRVGGALSPWLVVPLAIHLGWRAPFLIFGGFGLVWAGLWYSWYRDPATHNTAFPSPESAKLVGAPLASPTPTVPWRRLFRSRELWLIMAMYWCYVWGSMFYLSWLHTYLVNGRGLTEQEMGAYSALPFLMGMIGTLTGGFLGDRLVKRLGLSLGRRLMGSVSLGLTTLIFLATAMTSGKVSAIVLLSVGFGVMDCMLPSAWAICLDVGGPYAGAVSGAMNMAGSFGGFACAVSFGYLVKACGNYNGPLLAVAAMVAVSAVLFWMLDPTQPLLPEGATPDTSTKDLCR